MFNGRSSNITRCDRKIDLKGLFLSRMDFIQGEDSIEIEANGEARYELVFKPKTVGNWMGG